MNELETKEVTDIIKESDQVYSWLIKNLDSVKSIIPSTEDIRINNYLPVNDALMICWLIKHRNPKYYFEIGSGFSTLYARKAIDKFKKRTVIVSVDPSPRTNIEKAANYISEKKLQDIDLRSIDVLERGDVLFFDGSHKSSPDGNSDVDFFFKDVMPRLKPGIYVGIHDIFLPSVYPEYLSKNEYNEQDQLVTWMLKNKDKYKIILAWNYIQNTKRFKPHIRRMWTRTGIKNINYGTSFWMVIK